MNYKNYIAQIQDALKAMSESEKDTYILNLAKREDDEKREAFLKALGPAKPWLQHPGRAAQELRAYKHAKCPSCRQKVRVPRGKGKLRVTCPQCQEKFEVKS